MENQENIKNEIAQNKVLLELIDDIATNGIHTNYLMNKPRQFHVSFEIKKRTFIDKILFRKVKTFKVGEVFLAVAELANDYVKIMDGRRDIDLMLNAVSVLLLNNPKINEEKVIKLKHFLHWNIDVNEMVTLFELLINHASCFFLSSQYNNVKQQ